MPDNQPDKAFDEQYPAYVSLSSITAGRFGEVRSFVEIDSTNAYLLREACSGAPAGLVAVADYQTAGRGRLRRTWTAPPGSGLLFSVLLRPSVRDVSVQIPLLTLAAAVSMSETIESLPRGVSVADQILIKWPNDLQCHGRKLAGILTEGMLARERVEAVVVGIGVNLLLVDELVDGAPEAVSLEECGFVVERDVILSSFLRRFDETVDEVERGSIGELLDRYRQRCETIGRRVRAETAGGLVEGDAVNIDEEGSLLVVAAGEQHKVRFGEVIHLD